jgi:hypothetical protein
LLTLASSGGNYAVAEVEFPKEFAGAVQAEMDAAKSVL